MADNEQLGRWTIYFRETRFFSIIIFMVSLMTAALINTQAEMKQVVETLAFFALGNLIVGIAAQSINEQLGRWTIYFRETRFFSIIIFMVSLMTAALINTQAEMKQVVETLAFFALGNLIVGIAAQSMKMRK